MPRASLNPHVAHRGGLPARLRRLYPDPSLFERLGGGRCVAKIVDGLYDRLAADPALRPKFAGDLVQERKNQKQFFTEWLGGPPLYSQHIAFRGLRQIHDHLHISPKDAARWLRHFEAALEAAEVAPPLRKELFATLRPLARALVNHTRDAQPGEHRCHPGKRYAEAAQAADKGDVDTVRAASEEQPQLLGQMWACDMQTLLFRAAGRGRTDVVEMLLEAGADPHAVSHVGWYGALQTPIWAARARRRKKVIPLLLAAGAIDDIFTMAALGDLQGVQQWLDRDPDLLNVVDPAGDTWPITPLAVATLAGHRELSLYLLQQGAEVGPLSTLLVRSAAEKEDVAWVRALLDHGADATRIGAGRWVLHPELVELLSEQGADVSYAPTKSDEWVWSACTGNHGQRDDPEYVRAILAQGADPNALGGWGRAALHLAAKAGFVETVRVLLEAGADPNLPDLLNGETPLFHAFKAGKSVDPAAVAHALLDAGADPEIADQQGRTVGQRHPRSKPILDAWDRQR